MSVRMLFAAIAVSACASEHAQPEPVQALARPDWMSGYWLSCEDGVETAENWIGAGRGILLGTSLTRGAAYEFLRIAPGEAGGWSYYSMPGGRSPPTAFALVSNDGRRAVFENPAHDFPQRIVYARDGDVLTARIENMAGGDGMAWRFTRAAADSTCEG